MQISFRDLGTALRWIVGYTGAFLLLDVISTKNFSNLVPASIFLIIAWLGWRVLAWIGGLMGGLYLALQFPWLFLLGIVLLVIWIVGHLRKTRFITTNQGHIVKESARFRTKLSSTLVHSNLFGYGNVSSLNEAGSYLADVSATSIDRQSVDSVLSRIDVMQGAEFEKWLADRFLEMGFRVQWVGKGGSDQGADLILETTDKKIVVQAKRQSSRVSNDAVQQVLAAKLYYRAQEAWVITNNYFTANAKELAEKTYVYLIDRDDLRRWLLGLPITKFGP